MAVAAAAVFVWLGMVLAISFLEAPLKFRAPGVTAAIGVGIGRLVFKALNVAEAVLAVVAVVALAVAGGPLVLPVVPAALLAVQVLAVRPALSRRADAVLAGSDGPRSRMHLVYVALEVLKVAALLVAGVLLLP